MISCSRTGKLTYGDGVQSGEGLSGGDIILTAKGHEGTFWNDAKVSHIDLTAVTVVCTY